MAKQSKKRLLSILMPAYNEEQTISLILEKIYQVSLPDGLSKEIIIIDDCSTDKTYEKVKEFMAQFPDITIKYLKNESNRGKGYSVRRGISVATGEIIIIQDADLEYEPEDYVRMLPSILSGECKIVYGSRFLNGDNIYPYKSFYWGNQFLSLMTTLLYGQRITDESTCFKMFDASVIKNIPLTCDGFGFCPEVTAKAVQEGYPIQEVPIHYNPRLVEEGKKIKWQDGIEAIWLLCYYRIFYLPVKDRKPKSFIFRKVAFNVAAVLLAFCSVWGIYQSIPGYTWVYDSLLKGNYEVASQYRYLSADQRRELKMGFNFAYLSFIRDHTPENAVIWMPERDVWFPEGEKSPFNTDIINKMYRLRVLHPRKIVDARDQGNKYADKVTHVAIVNGRGYDKLNYEVEEKGAFAILPVR